MKFIPTEILPDIIVIEPDVYYDDRGCFMETYQYNDFVSNGIDYHFVQDNYSHSRKGVLRGLHYQVGHPQGKLVRVSSGKIFDVAVDIRRDSPTFGKWAGNILSDQNKKLVWVPIGFAHGFYTLSDYADVIYKVTDYYNHQSERCIVWSDTTLNIDWQIENNISIRISQKDAAGKPFLEAEVFE